MPKPPTTAIEKALAQAAMGILQEDYSREHNGRPSAAQLAQELYGRRESSAVTRHIKHGQPLAHDALERIKSLSRDAAIIARDWVAALSQRTPILKLRTVLADALRNLGASTRMIAMVTTRDVTEFPDELWDSLAAHPISSWFVVHMVLLRRCEYGASVDKSMAQAWRTGVTLVQNCMVRPCLCATAPTVWESTLQFAPSHIDVLRYGGIDDAHHPQARPLSEGIAERNLQFFSLVNFVPATIAGEAPSWRDKFPPPVAEFIQRVAFSRDVERVAKFAAIAPDSAEEWLALLCRHHDVFRHKHILLQKLGTIEHAFLPEGLPKTVH